MSARLWGHEAMSADIENVRPSRRRPLLPEAGAAGAPLMTVIAVISFLACLALAGFFFVRQAAQQWTSDLSGSITVQIVGDSPSVIDRDIAAAENVLRATSGVEEVRVYSLEQRRKLLEPWLGKGRVSDSLPVPGIIAVEVSPALRKDLSGLQMDLANRAPGARLDDHGVWNDSLSASARTGQILAFGIFLLIMVAACAVIIYAARAGLAANKEIIDVLHLVGASDEFIAAEVQRRFFVLGLRGALMGLSLAIIVLLLSGWALQGLEPSGYFLPAIRNNSATMVWLLMVPLLICTVAAVSAKQTVMRSLSGRW